MIRTRVDREQVARLLKADDVRALLEQDLNAAYRLLPSFMVDENGQALDGMTARRELGKLTIRAFVTLAQRFANDVAVTPQERRDIRFAFRQKAPTLPAWYRILDAARVWGCPPWVVAGDDQRALWFRRFSIVEDIRAEK